MHKPLLHICETINNRVGRAVSWLMLAAVLLMFGNVAMRYFFNAGAPWQMELVLFCHAITFMLAMGYTLQAEEHVRVDVLYAKFSAKSKAWVELLGALFFLFPLCFALVYFSWEFVASSWSLQEASSEYHGMPGVFLLKTVLLIGPGLLMLQGLANLLKAWEVIRG